MGRWSSVKVGAISCFYLIVLVWLHANRGQPPRSRSPYEGAAEPMRIIPARERPKSAGSSMSIENIDLPTRPRYWSMDESEILGLGAMDLSRLDSGISDSIGMSSSPQPSVSVKEKVIACEQVRFELN